MSDPILIVAALVAAGIVGAALLWPRGRAVAIPSRRIHPGRALIDQFEEVGRENAGRLIAERLGAVEADEIAQKFGRAFGQPTPNVPKP